MSAANTFYGHVYQTCKLCVPYVTICWGIFKRNNTGTMFNLPPPPLPTTNDRLCLASGLLPWGHIDRKPCPIYVSWWRQSTSIRADTLCCRIRECGIHGEADPDEEEQVLGDPEDGRAEEERGSPREQREHQRREQQPRPRSRPSQADSESFAAQRTLNTHDSGLVQLSVTFAVNLSLPARLRRFSLVFSSNCVLHNPNHQAGECPPWD